MADLICQKTMTRCHTPGMCSPFGGCQPSVLKDCDVHYGENTDESKAAEENRLKAQNRLLVAIPYLRKAVADAKKNGTVQLGILATYSDGSGKIEARFDADEFFQDLALVIGACEQTEEDDMKAEALKFIQVHGLKVGSD